MAFATGDFTTAQAEKEKKQGFFSRMLNAMVNARLREAQRRVTDELLSFDDKTLADLGFERSDLVVRRKSFM